MLAELLLTTLAILNATIPGQSLPLEVSVQTVPIAPANTAPVAAVAPTTPAGFTIDIATITAFLAMAGGVFAAFKKTLGKTDSRLNAVADTVTNVAQSVKATDFGAKDTAENLAKLAQAIPASVAPPQEVVQGITASAQDWKTDVKEYYDNIPIAPRKGELENDSVKAKLAQVNKITEKNEDGYDEA